MKLYKKIVACLIMLSAKSAIANIQQGNQSQDSQVTDAQIANSISVLVAAGVLEISDSKIVIKNQTALEELQARGRLTYVDASTSVVCF